MARFDVYPGMKGKGYLLDCQADILDTLSTRVVVPLHPVKGLPVTSRLNPIFEVEGVQCLMMTHHIFASPQQRLCRPVANLSEEHAVIMNALDLLLTGI